MDGGTRGGRPRGRPSKKWIETVERLVEDARAAGGSLPYTTLEAVVLEVFTRRVGSATRLDQPVSTPSAAGSTHAAGKRSSKHVTHQDTDELLDAHGVPDLPPDKQIEDRLSMTEATSAPLVDIALDHPNVKLIANALGTPPPEIIQQIQDAGRMVGALCGSPKHARMHVDAGLDFIIAQGGEGGGHTGEIGSVVLWPEVVDIAGDIPVIAAGGIGSGRQMFAALAMGAQGIWCGSLWLTVVEAATSPIEKELLLAAQSDQTVRSASVTGKPVRMLKNAWTDAWDSGNNPKSLDAPMQMMAVGRASARMRRYPEQARDLLFVPAGQIVGRLNQVMNARDVVMQLVEEYLETSDRLQQMLPSVD